MVEEFSTAAADLTVESSVVELMAVAAVKEFNGGGVIFGGGGIFNGGGRSNGGI